MQFAKCTLKYNEFIGLQKKIEPDFSFSLRECVSSGEDVSVNTVIILRNWRAILADLRSEATEEASIAPQFWGMMTVFTDTSDPELMYSHCYNVNTTRFLDLWLLHMSILVLSTPQKSNTSYVLLFWGVHITKSVLVLSTPLQIQKTGGVDIITMWMH